MGFLKLSIARLSISSIRQYSSSQNSSKFIRQQFLDFFIKENNHNFVRSSSVIPFCDKTLSFTNAGMNQVNLNISSNCSAYIFLLFSSRTSCLAIKFQDIQESPTPKSVSESAVNTMTSPSWEQTLITTLSLRCLETGLSVTTSRKMHAS